MSLESGTVGTGATSNDGSGSDEGGGSDESDSDDDNNAMSNNAMEALQQLQLQQALSAAASKAGGQALVTTNKKRENFFSDNTWRAKALIWPLSDLSGGDGKSPNKLLTMVLKMFDSCRHEPWFVPVSNWLEIESRARLGMYIKKIQSMYWFMKGAVFRNLMRDRKAAREQMEAFSRQIAKAQKYVRRFIYRRRVENLAREVLVKYIPDGGGQPYWYNPRTRLSILTKPKILGAYDCISIALPPPGKSLPLLNAISHSPSSPPPTD